MADDSARERILDAARALFCRRGYDGVSMRDVAERAGEKKASVFYHFHSKALLFDAVLESYYAAHAAALDGVDVAQGGVKQRLRRLIDHTIDFVEDNHAFVRLVQMEIARDSEVVPRIRAGLARLEGRVEDALRDVAPSDGPLAARQFFVTFSGIINTYFVYAPALAPLWKDDPLDARSRRERREHVHWVADALLARLVAAR